MELDHAKEIIQALADGVDPYTGDHFPPDSPYQRADTVRALFMALDAMGNPSRSGEPRPVDPNIPKAGAAWSPAEEQRLSDAFTAHKTIPEIAAAHGRTPGAITTRLVKLGLIEDSAANRAGRGNAPEPRGVRHPIPASPTSPPPRPAAMPPELTREEKDNLPF